MSFGRRRVCIENDRIDRSFTMPAITPSLWFDNNLEEAAEFYTSIFPNSSIEELHRTPKPDRATPGDVVSGFFVLDGTRFIGINGGPHFQFSEAVSFMVRCKDQDEVDYYWDRLVDRRRGVAVRLAEGPLRAELADRAGPIVRTEQRSGSGPRRRRHQGDARDAQDRHRRTGGGQRERVRLSAWTPQLVSRAIHSMVASLTCSTSAASSHMVTISDASDMIAIRTRDSS